ncbi:hypothetical protein PMZ80_010310 [Knufia obscura]|uniref:Uncharacterized protein n=2 Tax=Knufia TaxID=430999 RepID=A0AAN8IL29_9EURO|nr:hypothetical protein PMZ80_010310 [Knufia obscura]KAK5951817.1 hypothetical protein OHC33_007109 [Knufia fluminis]
MRLLAVLATLVASSGLALARSSSWDNWMPGQPVTTTVTMTLIHANETTTMTSYSSTSSTSASTTSTSQIVANVTSSSYSKPASTTLAPLSSSTTAAVASSTTAAIATFSSGAAVAQELDITIAALAGIGAVAYGLF